MSRHRMGREPLILAVDPFVLGLAIALALIVALAVGIIAW